MGFHIAAVGAALGMVNCVLAVVVLKRVSPSTEILPLVIAIALYCAAIVAIARAEPLLRHRRAGFIFLALANFLLAASLAIYVSHFVDRATSSPTHALESEHLGDVAALSGEHRYWMDGGLDQWVFVLFNRGLFAIAYSDLAVQEKGLLFLYAAVLRIAGTFNTYLLILVNCLGHLLSAWLLLRIASKFMPPRAALGAAGLLLVIPESLLWASWGHKDNLSVFLVLLCLWSGSNGFRADRRSLAFTALFILALAALAFVRSGVVVPVMFGCLLAIGLTRKPLLPALGNYLVALMMGAIFLAIALPPVVRADVLGQAFGRVYSRLVSGSSFGLDTQNMQFRTTKDDSLVYRISGGDLNWQKAYYVPIRVAMYFVAPFPPWLIKSSVDWFMLPSTWILILLSCPALAGMWMSATRTRGIATWALCFFVVLSVAIAFAGGFVHERYRLLLVPLYLAFASASEAHSPPRRMLALVLLSLLGFSALLGAYALVK
jgi:hypothetical protein